MPYTFILENKYCTVLYNNIDLSMVYFCFVLYKVSALIIRNTLKFSGMY